MSKQKFVCFNDGSIKIYREKEKKSNFAAKENARGLEDLEYICKLDFEQLSIRQQDQEFAEQNGFSVNMKLRTRFVSLVDSKCKAIIGNTLYDVSYIDKTRTDLYLYLEEVRQIDT